MNWSLANIVWAPDDWGLANDLLPSSYYVSWEHGCESKQAAIDFVEAAHYNGLIVSCDIIED